MKCKNCGGETKNNNVYCSLSCRNIYVNKNMRDYSKCAKTINENSIKRYEENPNFCEKCDNKIEYEKRDNKFCSKECVDYNINRRGIKHTLSKEGLKSLRVSNKSRDYSKKKEYYSNIKRCLCCDKMISFKRRINIFCDKDCKSKYYRENRTEIENYKKNCKFNFNLKDYEDEFDFSIIEKNGWYKAKNRGNNLDGVSRDHMYSIMEGFRNKIDTKLISHPANCELMIHNMNVSKNDKCSITIEELKNKISKWDKKYQEKN
jgi:hypothetical protein